MRMVDLRASNDSYNVVRGHGASGSNSWGQLQRGQTDDISVLAGAHVHGNNCGNFSVAHTVHVAVNMDQEAAALELLVLLPIQELKWNTHCIAWPVLEEVDGQR